ncbi:MAG: TolC family protein [Bacteriovoracaceae bacterium]|nr:TolC family protein [Bacteriovoracaceae bacterium]
MKGISFVLICLLISNNIYAQCSMNTPNDLLNLIKKNHPTISLNKTKGEALEKSIDLAAQTPNPELDIEGTVGDSFEGNVYTSALTIKHTFELGNKQGARVAVARNTYKLGLDAATFENEDSLIEAVKSLHRLRQIYEIIPLYEESLSAFNKILKTLKRRTSISPEQRVERETLELVTNDYRLKMSQLSSEKVKLSKHLSFFAGTNCIIPRNALPTNVNLSEKFTNKNTDTYSKLNYAKTALKLAQANHKLEKSFSYPDLKVGPTFEYEKLNVSDTKTVGIAVTFDLPVFNLNKGGKAKSAKEIIVASSRLRNIQEESLLDLESWQSTYNRYKESLLTIASKEELEKKHTRIEALFKRGIISTSLVIESHRQLIEFSNTRFEFEIGAVEALWNIYKLKGQINTKSI